MNVLTVSRMDRHASDHPKLDHPSLSATNTRNTSAYIFELHRPHKRLSIFIWYEYCASTMGSVMAGELDVRERGVLSGEL